MADRDDLVALILSSLEGISGPALSALSQALASESSLQLRRLWLLMGSPSQSLSVISFLDTLSLRHRRLLLGQVTLRLIGRITDFLEDRTEREPSTSEKANMGSTVANPRQDLDNQNPQDLGLDSEKPRPTGLNMEYPRRVGVGIVTPIVAAVDAANPRSANPRHAAVNIEKPRPSGSPGVDIAKPRLAAMDAENPRLAGLDAENPSLAGLDAKNLRLAGVEVSNPRIAGLNISPEFSNPSLADDKEDVSQPWGDTDAAFLLLFLSETQEQECEQAMQKWCIDPYVYQRFIVRDMAALVDDENKAGLIRAPKWRESLQQYLLQNILQVGYGIPGMIPSTNFPASLTSYIDTIGRFQRLLRSVSGEGSLEQRFPPASAATLVSLPRAVIGFCADYKAKLCSICGEEFEPTSLASQLPCLHVYHWECILTWLKQRNNCPVCRHELPTDDLDYELNRKKQTLRDRAP